ncbi:MAG: ABC transporter ATP-binding protein [Clostridium sp.]|uniref:ABC transporter ATP-binding protein n=1 Tax=Clostridium chrysemydis TaxID=2665504 RepID=UPI003EE6243B
MIEVKSITKTFGDRKLFDDFSVCIKNGEFIIFWGPSGCGKTTLLNIIGAIEAIDKGSVLVDGIDITKKKNQLNYYRNKVGFLFQNFALVENKTVLENLKFVKKNCKTEISIEKALEMVGLKDKLNSKVYTLSGGEQQRVALARLLIKKCDVILADEPTGSLDKVNADIVFNILKEFNNMGKTVIIVTHDEDIKNKGERVLNL